LKFLAFVLVSALFVCAVQAMPESDEDSRGLLGLILAIAFGLLLLSVI
jgi:hypothetical protein